MIKFIQKIISAQKEKPELKRFASIHDDMMPHVHFKSRPLDIDWETPQVNQNATRISFPVKFENQSGTLDFGFDLAGRPFSIRGTEVESVMFERSMLDREELSKTALLSIRTELMEQMVKAIREFRYEKSNMTTAFEPKKIWRDAEIKHTFEGCVVTVPIVHKGMTTKPHFKFNAYGDPVHMGLGRIVQRQISGGLNGTIESESKVIPLKESETTSRLQL